MPTSRRMSLLFVPVLAIAFAVLPVRAEVREEFHKTIAMDANGNFSLKNVNGGVNITAWDRNELQIDAVKSARSEEKLHEARIEVEGSGHSIYVKTQYPSDNNNNAASVEYTIHLPRGARLYEIETVNGSVHIDGMRGPVKAKTVNCAVEVWNAGDEVELNSVNGELKASVTIPGKGFVKLNTVNGGVSLRIPSATNAHVKASTVNGGISTDLPITVNKPRFGPGANVDTTLGSGGTNIEVETVNGSIHLGKS